MSLGPSSESSLYATSSRTIPIKFSTRSKEPFDEEFGQVIYDISIILINQEMFKEPNNKLKVISRLCPLFGDRDAKSFYKRLGFGFENYFSCKRGNHCFSFRSKY